MLKPNVILKTSQQLQDLQRFFFKEFKMNQLKTSPLALPFFNFVCYTVDLFTEYVKSPLDISFNIFVVDSHLRKYANHVQLYRRFMGFINSWKQYSETDEAKLFLSFLKASRNNKRSIKLFLKIRKVLLKNISHKILQQIIISHEDAVTITHTLQIISAQQRKILTKKINQYFITKTVRHSNNTKFNAAIICEYFMVDLNDKSQDTDKFSTYKSSNSMTYPPKFRDDFIEEFQEESIDQQEISFSNESLSNQFQTCKKITTRQDLVRKYSKENLQLVEQLYETQSKKPLVNLQKCMKELFILKEKDLEIDNRFKKINKVREDVDQY